MNSYKNRNSFLDGRSLSETQHIQIPTNSSIKQEYICPITTENYTNPYILISKLGVIISIIS